MPPSHPPVHPGATPADMFTKIIDGDWLLGGWMAFTSLLSTPSLPPPPPEGMRLGHAGRNPLEMRVVSAGGAALHATADGKVLESSIGPIAQLTKWRRPSCP